MSKPKFDPKKPYSDKKPAFNPEADFKVEGAEGDDQIRFQDIVRVGLKGPTMGASTRIVPALETGLNKITGDDREIGDIYDDELAQYQGQIADSERRLGPILTPLTETVGRFANPYAPKTGIGQTIEAATSGLMQTEGDMLSEEGAFNAAVGGAAGAAASLAGGLAKKGFKDPDAILGRMLGMRKADFAKTGVKDPKQIVSDLDGMGFFSRRAKSWDPETQKFVRGKELESMVKNSPQVLKNRATDAIRANNKYVKKYIPNEIHLDPRQVLAQFKEAAEDLVERGPHVGDSVNQAAKLIEGAIQRIQRKATVKNGKWVISADDLMSERSTWGDIAHSIYGNDPAAGSQVVKQFSKGVARAYKNLIEMNSSSPKEVARINMNTSRLYDAVEKLQDKVAGIKASGGTKEQFPALGDIGSEIFYKFMGGDSTAPIRASVGKDVKAMGGEVIEDALPRGAGEAVQEFYKEDAPQRRPQSVPNIPEQLIRTPLPRSTQGLMQNKKMVLMKVAQQAPELFETVTDMFENNPEMIPEIVPVLAQKMPHFFEKDKYNRFDGRIMSEADKQKAIKDTLINKSLSSIEQAKKISRLNEEGLYDD